MARLAGLISCAALAAMCGGCVYTGAKVTEGVDLAVGLSVPGTEGAAQLSIINYLSGFRLGVARNARMTVRYTSATTNSWLGCIHTEAYKVVDAEVVPVEPPATNAAPAVAEAEGQ